MIFTPKSGCQLGGPSALRQSLLSIGISLATAAPLSLPLNLAAATLTDSQRAMLEAATATMTPAQRAAAANQASQLTAADAANLEKALKGNALSVQNLQSALLGNLGSGGAPAVPPSQPGPAVATQQSGLVGQSSGSVIATAVSSPSHSSSADSGSAPGQVGQSPVVQSSAPLVAIMPLATREEVYRINESSRKISAIQPFIERLASSRLKQAVLGYGPHTPLEANLRFRGLKMTISSPAGSPNMRLEIPGAKIDYTASSSSRDLSLLRVGSYLTGDDTRGVERILKGVVANTTDDPIAGNPSSLLGRMLAMDFRSGTDTFGFPGEIAQADIGTFGSASLLAWHQFNGSSISTLSVPVTLGHEIDDRLKLYGNVVPAIQQVRGQAVFSSMLAIGARYELYRSEDWVWSAGASTRVGIAGSSEVEGVGGFFGGAASSELQYQLNPQTRIGAALTVSHYRSLPITFSEYRIKYDLQATGIKTGISATRDVGRIFDLSSSVSASVSDSRFSGEKLAVQSWQEYGVLVSMGKEVPVRVGLAYFRGEKKIQGISLRASISF